MASESEKHLSRTAVHKDVGGSTSVFPAPDDSAAGIPLVPREAMATLADGVQLPSFHDAEDEVTEVNMRASWFEETAPSSRTLTQTRASAVDTGPQTIPAPPQWDSSPPSNPRKP
jgi:hypothetical protein